MGSEGGRGPVSAVRIYKGGVWEAIAGGLKDLGMIIRPPKGAMSRQASSQASGPERPCKMRLKLW